MMASAMSGIKGFSARCPVSLLNRVTLRLREISSSVQEVVVMEDLRYPSWFAQKVEEQGRSGVIEVVMLAVIMPTEKGTSVRQIWNSQRTEVVSILKVPLELCVMVLRILFSSSSRYSKPNLEFWGTDTRRTAK